MNYFRPSRTSSLGHALRSNSGGTIPVLLQQHRDQRLLGVHPDEITHGTHHLDAAALSFTTENRTQRLWSQFHDVDQVATPSLWWSVCFVDKCVLFLHPRLDCQHPVRATSLVRFSTGAAPRTTPLRLLSAMTIGDPPQEVLHWEQAQFGHTYGKVTHVLTSLLLDPPQEASTLTHDCLQDLLLPYVAFLRTTQIFSHTKAGQFEVHSLSTLLQLPSLSAFAASFAH